MVMVHSFRVYDGRTDEFIVPGRKSTEERIAGIPGASIIPGTAEDVDPSWLDEFGRYDPLRPQQQRPGT